MTVLRVYRDQVWDFNAASDRRLPPIPVGVREFWTGGKWERATVGHWEWSDTYGRWGAVVTLGNGRTIFAYPKRGRG